MWHVAGRTYELVEFLTTVVRADLSGLRLSLSAAYHPACPLRTLAVPDDTPRVLRQLGVTAQPLPAADVCCGFGGPFAERYPSISRAMADAKARAVAAAGADVLVCNEAGCTMTIGKACERAELRIAIRHPAELIAEALGLDADRW